MPDFRRIQGNASSVMEGLVGAEGAEEVLRRAGYDAGRMRRGVEAAAKGGELQELFDEVLRDSGYLK